MLKAFGSDKRGVLLNTISRSAYIQQLNHFLRFLQSFSAGSFFSFARALSVAVYFSSDTNSYLIQHIAVAYVFVLATVPYAPPSSKSARI